MLSIFLKYLTLKVIPCYRYRAQDSVLCCSHTRGIVLWIKLRDLLGWITPQDLRFYGQYCRICSMLLETPQDLLQSYWPHRRICCRAIDHTAGSIVELLTTRRICCRAIDHTAGSVAELLTTPQDLLQNYWPHRRICCRAIDHTAGSVDELLTTL